jgi:hypothetical protein
MMFKLAQAASKRRPRLDGHEHFPAILEGGSSPEFVGGVGDFSVVEEGCFEALRGKKIIVAEAVQEALGPLGPKASGIIFPP